MYPKPDNNGWIQSLLVDKGYAQATFISKLPRVQITSQQRLQIP